MAGVPPAVFDKTTFTTEEGLSYLNDWLTKLITAVNTHAGLHGPVTMLAPINMNGHPITGVGPSTSPSAAVSQGSAASQFGAAAVQKQIEQTGNNMLQSVRRLNDILQREHSSSFLNEILNVPPGSNTSQVTLTNNGDGTTTVSLTGGNYQFGDKSIVSYASRIDRVGNPGSGSNTYYYYLRKSDNTLQFVGPFTTATSFNALGANVDGRGFVAKAVVQAAGGGTGGGGADPGGGGCLELGTPLRFPEGKKFTLELEPCDDWLVVDLGPGPCLTAARNTRIAVFKKVQDLDEGDLLCDESGNFVRVESVTESHHRGTKMKAKVDGGVYYGRGVLLHNVKPNL